MLSFLLFTLACSDPNNNDADASGMPYCDETSQSIARDDDSGIGIPASDFLDALPFAEDLSLKWAEELDDSLTWSFAADESTLALVETEAVYPETDGATPAIAVDCHDYISIGGTLSLASGDGRLEEELEITIQLFGGSSGGEGPLAIVSEVLDVGDLQGALDVSDYLDPSEYDSMDLRLGGEIYFGEEMLEFVGQLRVRGEVTNGDLALLESADIATWGPALSEQ